MERIDNCLELLSNPFNLIVLTFHSYRTPAFWPYISPEFISTHKQWQVPEAVGLAILAFN